MFIYDKGLFLQRPRIGIDVARPLQAGFVSHAHFDHMARHGLIYCTQETAAILEYRLGKRPLRIMEYGVPIEIGDARLTALPAGHVAGSAMLLVETAGQRALYTGDFQLEKAHTARAAEFQEIDLLIMECTFGHPNFAFGPRQQLIDELIAIVRSSIAKGQVPVIQAYVVGKAQEVTRILCDAGISVYLHPEIFRISRIYEELGIPLGDYRLYENGPIPGAAVIRPPSHHQAESIGQIHRAIKIGLTGWALDEKARQKMDVDVAIPFSDHADYVQLLKAVELSSPKRILCMHGFKRFAHDLKSRGYHAEFLDHNRVYCP